MMALVGLPIDDWSMTCVPFDASPEIGIVDAAADGSLRKAGAQGCDSFVMAVTPPETVALEGDKATTLGVFEKVKRILQKILWGQ
jgi:hypothetical protein